MNSPREGLMIASGVVVEVDPSSLPTVNLDPSKRTQAKRPKRRKSFLASVALHGLIVCEALALAHWGLAGRASQAPNVAPPVKIIFEAAKVEPVEPVAQGKNFDGVLQVQPVQNMSTKPSFQRKLESIPTPSQRPNIVRKLVPQKAARTSKSHPVKPQMESRLPPSPRLLRTERGNDRGVPSSVIAVKKQGDNGLLLMQNYRSQLARHIKKHKYYPKTARRKKQEGRAIVKFTLDDKGEIIRYRVLESAGFHLLDHGALETLRRASPFPIPPSGTRTFEIPIKYSLKRR